MFKKKTKINGLIILKTKIFKDYRGSLKEVFQNRVLKKDFVFDVMSKSKKKVLRGLHIQTKNAQAKLITVTHGKIFDVAVDLRKKSKTFGKYFTTVISEKNSKSIFIPPGFAHGFLSLDKENFVIYSCTKYRSKSDEIGIKYNDSSLKIKWPSNKIILSDKDKKNLSFEEYKKNYIK